MISAGCYKIVRGERLFAPFDDMLIFTSAFAYATTALKDGRPLTRRDTAFNFPCRQLPFRVSVPIHGPIEAYLRNDPAVDFTFEVSPLSRPDPPLRSPADSLEDDRMILSKMISPTFVVFYERQKEWVEKIYIN
jgi:hypothetical protein